MSTEVLLGVVVVTLVLTNLWSMLLSRQIKELRTQVNDMDGDIKAHQSAHTKGLFLY